MIQVRCTHSCLGGNEGRRGGPSPRREYGLDQHGRHVPVLPAATRHDRKNPLYEPAARRNVGADATAIVAATPANYFFGSVTFAVRTIRN